MDKIILSADSSSDLPEDIKERYNIHMAPLHTILKDKDYLDGIDIKPEYIFDYYDKYGISPKTAAISPGEYIEYFTKLKEDNKDAHIIHFNLGSRLSSCYQNACLAKNEIDNLHVIDTMNLSSGSGLLVLEAVDLIKEGLAIKEILEKLIDARSRIKCSFVVDSLEYIEAGGRIPKGTTKGTNLFKIKAKLRVDANEKGAIHLDKVYRGDFEKAIFKYSKEILKDSDNINKSRIFITASEPCISDRAFLNKIENLIKEAGINEILHAKAGCTISSHCGPNTLGLLYVAKK